MRHLIVTDRGSASFRCECGWSYTARLLFPVWRALHAVGGHVFAQHTVGLTRQTVPAPGIAPEWTPDRPS